MAMSALAFKKMWLARSATIATAPSSSHTSVITRRNAYSMARTVWRAQLWRDAARAPAVHAADAHALLQTIKDGYPSERAALKARIAAWPTVELDLNEPEAEAAPLVELASDDDVVMPSDWQEVTDSDTDAADFDAEGEAHKRKRKEHPLAHLFHKKSARV